MTYVSICSGIEAATVAWHPLGWSPLGFSEIEPFPSAVLAHHWPDVPNLGDMTRFHEWPDTVRPHLIVGGTPCQAFSVAGLRRGLADPRGNLTLVFLGILERFRPRWVVWENVPGVLSDGTGAFGSFLGGLAQLGYGFAYRVLDAQHFGVPQRRRRVFVVGYLGDWRRAAAVLFEPASLRRDPPPRRKAREGVAPTLAARTRGGGGLGTDFDLDGGLIQSGKQWPVETAPTLNAAFGEKQGLEDQHALGGAGLFVEVASSAKNRDGQWISPTVTSKWSKGSGGPSGGECGNLVTSHTLQTSCSRVCEDGTGRGAPLVPVAHVDVMPTMRSGSGGAAMQVRRLTPRECERLQGFPDDHTLIPWRGRTAEECPDGPRYKALGNSMAVPVMRWIGQRIQAMEEDAP